MEEDEKARKGWGWGKEGENQASVGQPRVRSQNPAESGEAGGLT